MISSYFCIFVAAIILYHISTSDLVHLLIHWFTCLSTLLYCVYYDDVTIYMYICCSNRPPYYLYWSFTIFLFMVLCIYHVYNTTVSTILHRNFRCTHHIEYYMALSLSHIYITTIFSCFNNTVAFTLYLIIGYNNHIPKLTISLLLLIYTDNFVHIYCCFQFTTFILPPSYAAIVLHLYTLGNLPLSF